ncbi:hypothetical protein TNCV_819081, partial [Trichonephila clavipes]
AMKRAARYQSVDRGLRSTDVEDTVKQTRSSNIHQMAQYGCLDRRYYLGCPPRNLTERSKLQGL